MSYSKVEEQFIFDIKRSIVNEFRYHKELLFGIEEIDHLSESYLICMSEKEKGLMLNLNFIDLFSSALRELNYEGIIEFIDDRTIAISELGFQRFIVPDKMYE